MEAPGRPRQRDGGRGERGGCPASELRAAQQRIRELERLIGKKAMEVEILQAARDEVNTKPHWYAGCPASQGDPLGAQAMTGRKVATICRVLGSGRATAYCEGTPRSGR